MELVETYKFGRWTRGLYRCEKCGETKTKKLKLIPYSRKKGIISKGCTVPWGKEKKTKFPPKKKDKPKKRRGY